MTKDDRRYYFHPDGRMTVITGPEWDRVQGRYPTSFRDNWTKEELSQQLQKLGMRPSPEIEGCPTCKAS